MNFPFEKFKNGLIKCGLKLETYEEFLPEWILEHGDNIQSRKDYIWHIYQLLISNYADKLSINPQLMYQQMRKAYLEMFSFLSEEKKDKTVAMKGLIHCDIHLAALTGLKTSGSIIAKGCCFECDKINGHDAPLEDLLEESILPHPKCTREEGCICSYGFQTFRDRKGRLIKQAY